MIKQPRYKIGRKVTVFGIKGEIAGYGEYRGSPRYIVELAKGHFLDSNEILFISVIVATENNIVPVRGKRI